MNRTFNSLARQLVACSVVACFAAAPALAGTTDISNVPLASGTPLPPNVLFTLDNSGSMDFDFLPDNVDPQGFVDLGASSTSPSNPCMTDMAGGGAGSTWTHCERGEPPHEAGGQNGSNGVSYDPTLRYLPGVTSTGAVKFNPPSGTFTPFTSVPNDAYGSTSGTANLVTGAGVINTNSVAGAFDKQYCNSASTPKACKRNGANNSGIITPSGTLDPEGNSLAAGQFPYRANVSSSSVRNFGMPEMMTTASFSRSGTTVTAATPGKPGLAVNDRVWVSASAALNVSCVLVTAVSANSFTYTAGSSGTVAATAGVYRKCSSGTWTRSGSTVTVTPTSPNDQLQTSDLALIDSSDNAQDQLGTAVAVTVPVLTPTTFTYTGANSGAASGTVSWVRTSLYNISTALTAPVSPTAYTITPIEYCSDINLTTCVEVIPPAVPPAGFFPAYVRFCKVQADAIAPGAVTGTSGAPASARCQAKYTNPTAPLYQFARYGRFNRESIISAALTPSFGNRPARTDCASVPVCSYAEEMENFSRWYTYYRTRMQMMKTAVGRAFLNFVSNPSGTPPRPDTLRVGFITINSPTSGTNYLKISNFTPAQAVNWYTSLYTANPGGGTPLREALSRAGWIFAGKLNTGLTAGIPAPDDPVQASCQRNYSILTTDGFWNGNAGQTLSGGAIGNLDSTLSAAGTDRLVSREGGIYDGGSAVGATGTLADVAQYYYQTDLRNAGAGPLTSPNATPANSDVSANNVPAKSGNKDFLTTQHMVTYTLGLADGLMRYQTDYDTANSGDFFNITQATPGGCFWVAGAGNPCNWPVPTADNPSALDDLWHAAVNGRGTFYQALNASALTQSLSNALGNLNAQTAAAAASATSSPNITQTDNQIFSTTYQTNTWSGKIFAQTIDPVTGNVNPTVQWQADDRMALITGASTDTRKIWTPDPLHGGLQQFTYANISANAIGVETSWFQKKCTAPAPNAAMSQCGSLTITNKAVADSGANMVNFLRGQSANESGPGCLVCVYRDRQELDPITNAVTQTVIGDTINAKPTFIRGAIFDYADSVTPTYASFQVSMGSRAARLYVGANDGYVHNFNATTGDEVWAYAPRFLLPGIYQLADTAYSANHRFFVDGSPETGDVFDVTAGQWKTILVGGAGAGGRGFYALDVTNENSPLSLWEFCADATLCVAHNDPDLGLSYGNPVIGKRASDGRWVVVLSSGLNNGSPSTTGGGFFYVLDAITGAVLNKIPTQLSGTNVGTLATPSGLMKLSGYYDNALKDATFSYVYGGDQLGNIWRMDMTVSPPTVLRIAALKDATARAQPITTRMALTHIGGSRIIYVGTGRYLGATDLVDPGAPSGIAWQQSIYAIKDKVIDTSTDYGDIRAGGTLVVQTLINASTTTRTTSTLPVDWNLKNGWMIDLNPGNSTPGERVNVDPELIIGTLLIASNIPTTSAACTVGGESFLYQFDFKSGQYVVNSLNNVAGQLLGGITVGMAVVQLPSGVIKDILTTADTTKTSQGVNVGAATAYLRRFSYRER